VMNVISGARLICVSAFTLIVVSGCMELGWIIEAPVCGLAKAVDPCAQATGVMAIASAMVENSACFMGNSPIDQN